jgi:hypothetical protein
MCQGVKIGITYLFFSNFCFIKALKAIALLRMGRQEEAVSSMGTVLSSHPGDQATLQACTMYFKENSDCKFWPT